jgi:hypothetical protein
MLTKSLLPHCSTRVLTEEAIRYRAVSCVSARRFGRQQSIRTNALEIIDSCPCCKLSYRHRPSNPVQMAGDGCLNNRQPERQRISGTNFTRRCTVRKWLVQSGPCMVGNLLGAIRYLAECLHNHQLSAITNDFNPRRTISARCPMEPTRRI